MTAFTSRGPADRSGRTPPPSDTRPVPVGPGRGRRKSGRGSRRGRLARNPQWPIIAVLVGYPIWWALGVADFMWFILAVPIIFRMVAWRTRGNRKIRMPPGFVLWALFLVWVLAGISTLSLTAPGTIASPLSHRVVSFIVRLLSYLGVTVFLLYTGNLTETELPRRRLAWALGLFAIYATIGGLAGTALPHFQFSSPALFVIPHSLQSNVQIQAVMHPGFAQVQKVLGAPEGRPKAPFDYTNTWGNCLAILLPWLIAGWWLRGSRRLRRIAGFALVLSIVPIVYSLNRGLWMGLGVAILYLALRLALKGRLAMLGAIVAGLAVCAVLIFATPLQQIIALRLQHGKSDNLRSSLSATAIQDGLASPLIGYGDTRQQIGSPNSIAIGPRPNCSNCGQSSVGSNGQLWLLLVCNGILGTAFYLSFFLYGIWRYRRDPTPYGMAGVLVLVLSFVFMFAYDAVGAPLAITMIVYALLWKNERERWSDDAVPAELADESTPDWAGRAIPARSHV